MNFAFSLPLALAAALLDVTVGYPQAVYRAIGHPVTWMGAFVAALESRLNRPTLAFEVGRASGVFALALYLGAVGVVAGLVSSLAPSGVVGFAALALLASSLPAQQSLDRHVLAVARGLEQGGLAAGRSAVAKIVGRNPETLDEAGVARAALESLAENFSDGVVAPLFWIALGGVTGGALYKAVNTADSMIGHKTERFLAFGWAAARLDDLVNLPASRLAALWLIAAAAVTPDASAREAWLTVARDAGRHRSPNAGWPEAAIAGALGLKLAGPRVYGDRLVDDAFMGAGRREADAADIIRALKLYRASCVIQALALAGAALIAQA
ncbi:MAG: adenosylcobinamide-phosphate synthase CbiB [Roseiarcus sp.]|uniref:adenosylcobinamide-phosphate synthase CbiB n=1 Tax=Roseiarcus sp. TaxID=1969460 RepID=UPI003C51117F